MTFLAVIIGLFFCFISKHFEDEGNIPLSYISFLVGLTLIVGGVFMGGVFK